MFWGRALGARSRARSRVPRRAHAASHTRTARRPTPRAPLAPRPPRLILAGRKDSANRTDRCSSPPPAPVAFANPQAPGRMAADLGDLQPSARADYGHQGANRPVPIGAGDSRNHPARDRDLETVLGHAGEGLGEGRLGNVRERVAESVDKADATLDLVAYHEGR